MSYATLDDIKKLISESDLILLTDDADNGTIDEQVVNDAIETASIVIDSYISKKVEYPLSEAYETLTVICMKEAGYLLHVRRGNVSETWKEMHREAIEGLKEILANERGLGVDDPSGTGDTTTMQIDTPEPLFGDDELEKF